VMTSLHDRHLPEEGFERFSQAPDYLGKWVKGNQETNYYGFTHTIRACYYSSPSSINHSLIVSYYKSTNINERGFHSSILRLRFRHLRAFGS
jgi:hypothetical protein